MNLYIKKKERKKEIKKIGYEDTNTHLTKTHCHAH